MKKGLALSKKEERRLNLIVGIEAKQLTVQEMATALDLSERQVWRLLSRYGLEKSLVLAHKIRAKPPPTASRRQRDGGSVFGEGRI